MKQLKNRIGVLLKNNSKIKLYIGLLLMVIGVIFVFTNKAQFSDFVVTSPSGEKENGCNPYNSFMDGEVAIYKYDLTLTNSFLFSGILQIIPDDCLKKVSVNGIKVPLSDIAERKCDCLNGFYLDLSKLLKKGENQLHFEVQNTHGYYGLNLIDKTFYEKYILLFALILVFCFLDLKRISLLGMDKLKIFLNRDRTLFLILLGLFTLLFLSVLGSTLIENVSGFVWVLSGLMISIVVIPVVYLINTGFKRGKITALLLLSALFVWILYAIFIPYSSFSYDAEGHLDYVRYLYENGYVPVSTGGWSFYHPSLYYFCVSSLWKAVNFSGHFNEDALLKLSQVFSLILFVVYSYFSLKTIDLFFRHLDKSLEVTSKRSVNLAYFSSVALFLFWPSNAVFSVRFGNDILFNVFYAVSFYFTVSWWFTKRVRDFVLALIFVSFGIWSKTNAFTLLGIIGVLFGCRFLLDKSRKSHWSDYSHLMILLVAFSVAVLYLSFNEKFKDGANNQLIVGNANSLSDWLKVGNEPVNFMEFNPAAFVEIPFTNSFDDQMGRQSFWFYLLKSCMFGEFGFDKPVSIVLAKGLSFLLILLLVLFVTGFLVSLNRKSVPIVVGFCVLIGSMLVFRYILPYACSNDFRYIFPAILPMVLFTGFAQLYLVKSEILYGLSNVVVYGFVLFSFAFPIAYLLF